MGEHENIGYNGIIENIKDYFRSFKIIDERCPGIKQIKLPLTYRNFSINNVDQTTRAYYTTKNLTNLKLILLQAAYKLGYKMLPGILPTWECLRYTEAGLFSDNIMTPHAGDNMIELTLIKNQLYILNQCYYNKKIVLMDSQEPTQSYVHMAGTNSAMEFSDPYTDNIETPNFYHSDDGVPNCYKYLHLYVNTDCIIEP